ncbi:MAG: hypothetical protein ACRYF3_10825 [Janthinobacterium lividum]
MWTGSQVLVWGGSSPFSDGCAVTLTADGASWTPDPDGRGSWAVMPPAPLAARSDAQLWWTGSSAVLIGGYDPWAACETRPAGFLDVAVFTPGATAGAGSWSRLPDLPWPAATTVAASTWIGDEDGEGNPGAGRVLAWSPEAGAWSLRVGASGWTRLPAPPLTVPNSSVTSPWSSVRSWWTGTEWLLMGRAGSPESVDVGLAFDPGSSSWRNIDPGPLTDVDVNAVWSGSRLLTFDPLAGLSAFDPAANLWAATHPGPLDTIGAYAVNGGPALAWTGTELLVWGGARKARDTSTCIDGDGPDDPAFRFGGSCNPAPGPLGAAYEPATGSWRTIPDGPWQRRAGSSAVWTGTSLFLAGGVDLEERRNGALPHSDHPDTAFALFTPE